MIIARFFPATREGWLRQYAAQKAAEQAEQCRWASLSFWQKVVDLWRLLR